MAVNPRTSTGSRALESWLWDIGSQHWNYYSTILNDELLQESMSRAVGTLMYVLSREPLVSRTLVQLPKYTSLFAEVIGHDVWRTRWLINNGNQVSVPAIFHQYRYVMTDFGPILVKN